MSQPEWMQKFKQIGQKGEEEVTTVGEEGSIVKTTVTPPKAERVDTTAATTSIPTTTSAATTVPKPFTPSSQSGETKVEADDDEDAAALFFGAAGGGGGGGGASVSTGFVSDGTSLGILPSEDGSNNTDSDNAAALFYGGGGGNGTDGVLGGGGDADSDPPSLVSATMDPSNSTGDDDAAAMYHSAGDIGTDDEDNVPSGATTNDSVSNDNSWVVDKNKFLREEMKQEFAEEVVTENRNLGEEHYEDVYVDDDGNELYVDEEGNEILQDEEEEVLLDEDGNELPVEEENDELLTDEALAADVTVAATQETPASEERQGMIAQDEPQVFYPPPEPEVFLQLYDIEDQRRVLQTTKPGKRSRMSMYVPISAFLAFVSAILLVVFLVGLDDGKQPSGGSPTMAPTPMQYLPLTPTSNGNIQAAATTRFEPVQNNCDDLDSLPQPNFIDQCACDGEVTILADDVRARRQDLMINFMPSVLPSWNETVSSCTAENQALLWLSSGINNGGEVSNLLRLQRYALAFLYVAQGGTQWRMSTDWMSERNVCDWVNVECDTNSYVRTLNLNNNRLTGQVSW
jgi:hypothetical protein